ncbi:MAG TPA: DUF952 domain-containing protein [Tahibacter sp.]|uniref:DUF952 domain-containing protein n=1 Tax=Tahibacter sp. TaxID=2056211 RepID=UPI002CBD6043|nr:DUF952 domain-containing protein [Tahibacter sp.]HSX59585.1 DUF952 domain-containing protein [Tahibacter sp.]
MTTVYKIVAASQWEDAERTGAFAGSEVDTRDGFIHLSTSEQARQTAALHFNGQAGLLLVAVDAEALGDALKYEPSRGGALFPHLYAPLSTASVRWVRPLPLDVAGNHVFPALSGAEMPKSRS